MENSYISAVVYLHNDEEFITDFLDNVFSMFKNNFMSYEFVFVNDYCEDSTIELIRSFFKNKTDENVSIVNLCYYHGLQNAMKAGVDLCIGDYIYEFDNVFPMYDPSVIFQLFKESQQGFDIVAASENKKPPFLKNIFYKLFNKYSIIPGHIEPEFFRLYSRRTLNRMNEINQFVVYRRAIYATTGLKKKNVYFNCSRKIDIKKAHISRKTKKETAFNALLLFTFFPRKLCKWVIMISSFLMLSSSIFLVLSLLLWQSLVIASTVVFVSSILLLAISCLFAFVIAYLQVVASYTVSKISYNFESVEKITNQKA